MWIRWALKNQIQSFLGRVFIAVMKLYDQKQFREERVYFILQLSGHTLTEGEVRIRSPGKNLQAGTETKVMEKCCLLTCSCLFLLLFSTVQYHLPRCGTTHSVLDPL
jgi:aconitase B